MQKAIGELLFESHFFSGRQGALPRRAVMTRYKDAKQSAESLGQAASRGPTQQSDSKVT